MSVSPARRLLGLVAPWRPLLVASLVSATLASALDSVTIVTLVPVLKHLFGTAGALAGGGTSLERWVDRVTAPLLAGTTPDQALGRLVLLLVVGLTLKNVFSYLASQLSVRMQEGLVADLRSRLFAHLLQVDLGFFQRTRGGELVNSVVQETDQGKGIVTASLISLFQNVVLVATTLTLLLSISVRLTLVSFICLPPLVIGVQALLRRLRQHARARTDERAQLAGRVAERLGAMKLIRAYDTREEEARSFAGLARSYAKKAVRTQRFSSLVAPVSEAFSASSVLLLLYAATHPALLGLATALTPEVVIVFLMASLRLTSPFKAISRFPADFTTAMASLERVFRLLDEPATDVDPPGARTATFAREIAFEDVSFAYAGGEAVLRNVELQLPLGRIVALVGPSGGGKTTLADLLPRLHDPSSGRVLLDGVPTTACSFASVRRLMAIVSQDTVLLHDTVHANIAYGMPGASREAVERAAQAANAHEFVARLPQGYDTVIGERGARLSGGQRQRIAIARALLRDAPILILDEATSALDTQSERLVQEAIERLMARRTVLVIAHRLATVREAHEILVLDEGRIVQRGAHEELLQQGGLYRRLYELQFREEVLAERREDGR